MNRLNLVRVGALAAVAALTLAALTSPAAASHDDAYTFAVIGDIPYGDPAITRFPADIAQINNDPSVRWIDHLGDIKNGSSVCSDEYFQRIKTDFDLFQDPLVYTILDSSGVFDPSVGLSA